MFRKIVAVWVSLTMLLGVVVIVDVVTDITLPVRAATITVDDSGGADYLTIQEAINAANEGDTIYVYNGTYYENVLIFKTLNLIGEDKNNTVIDGGGDGIVVKIGDDWVNVTNFSIIGSGSSTGDYGIDSDNVNYLTIANNIITNNRNGISISDSTGTIIRDNIVFSNLILGIGIHYSNNNEIIRNTVYSNPSRNIVLGTSDSNNITDNVCYQSVDGIYLGASNWNNISGNSVYSCEYGMEINFQCGNNRVISNNISFNYIGIRLLSKPISGVYNYIIKNNITYNTLGVYLQSTEWNNITENNMMGNGIYISGDSFDEWDTHEIDTLNTVNGKPVYYWKNEVGLTVPTDAGQVILACCNGFNISNLDLINCTVGIELGFSNNNNITWNNISGGRYGIFLYSSNGNTLINNRIEQFLESDIISSSGITSHGDSTNNIFVNNNVTLYSYGFYMVGSSYELIYHNNIINNSIQAVSNKDNSWDNGYPSGGNFWSDYNGTDEYNGPNQDIPGNDGIGDTNYTINKNLWDNYPLMYPVGFYIYLYEGWNLVSIPFVQPETSLSQVLSSIQSKYNAVQWYNASDPNDKWKHYNPSRSPGLNDFESIDHTIAFWIHITEPGGVLFKYLGHHPTSNQTIQLYPGWNMVGYPSLTSYNRTIGLNNLNFGTDIDAIWSYNAAAGKWEEMDESDSFFLGRGYWIHSKVTKVWDVPL